MNASRNGSAARASRNRKIGNRGAGGEAGVPSGSAAVVVEWDGVANVLSCAPAMGATLRPRNYSLLVRNNQRKFGQRGCPKQKPPDAHARQVGRPFAAAAKGRGGQCPGLRAAFRIAGTVVRTPVAERCQHSP